MSQRLRLPSRKIVEPYTRDPVPRGVTEKWKERLPHPLGQFEVGGVELPRLVREKNIECPASALVRFEQRYVARHPRPRHSGAELSSPRSKAELLGGSHPVGLVANRTRRAEDAPDGVADGTIRRQYIVAGHRFALFNQASLASLSTRTWCFVFHVFQKTPVPAPG
jgi:hypothetical protein